MTRLGSWFRRKVDQYAYWLIYERGNREPLDIGFYHCAAHPKYLIKDCPHEHDSWEH